MCAFSIFNGPNVGGLWDIFEKVMAKYVDNFYISHQKKLEKTYFYLLSMWKMTVPDRLLPSVEFFLQDVQSKPVASWELFHGYAIFCKASLRRKISLDSLKDMDQKYMPGLTLSWKYHGASKKDGSKCKWEDGAKGFTRSK